jgi:hypothetical protein
VTVAATLSGRRYITATMKKVSAAKHTKKPSHLSATAAAANAPHAAKARGALDQSTGASFPETLAITRTSERPAIAIPYQSGKNPGPGPSGPRYSQRAASATM